MVAVGAIAVWFAARDAVLFQDDYAFLGEAQENGGSSWGWSWLVRPLFAHFSPVGRAEYGALLLGPDVWSTARAVMLLNLLAAGFALVWLARELGASFASAAWAALWFVSSLVVWRLLQWWGAWVIVFVHLPFILVMAASFLRYVRTGRTFWAVVALGTTILACATYESSYLAPLWAVLVLGLHLSHSRVTRASPRRIAAFLGLQVLVCAAFLIAYISNYSAEPQKPTPLEFLTFIRDYVIAVTIPAVVGLKQPGILVGDVPEVLIASAVALGVVCIHYRRQWRELCLFGLAVLGLAGLFAFGRAGVGVLRLSTSWDYVYVADLQYYIDATGVVALAIAILPSRRGWPRGRPWLVPAVLTVLSILGASMQGRPVLLGENPWLAAREWTSAVRNLGGTSLPGGGYLASGFAPAAVTLPQWDRFAELSYVTYWHAFGLPIGAGPGKPLLLNEHGEVSDLGETVSRGEIDRCISDGSIDIPAVLTGDDRAAQVLQVEYWASAPAQVDLTHLVGGSPVKFEGTRRFGTWRPIVLPEGTGMSFSRALAGPADQVRLSLGGGPVCLGSWRLLTGSSN